MTSLMSSAEDTADAMKMDSNVQFENSETVIPLSAELLIPFPTQDLATVAYNTLSVDKEPKRSFTKRTLSVVDNYLKVQFSAPETRQLRTSINSFFDLLLVAVRGIEEFAPPDFKIEP